MLFDRLTSLSHVKVTVICAGVMLLLSLWEIIHNIGLIFGDIYWHFIKWRSVCLYLPQLLTGGLAAGGYWIALNRKELLHWKLATAAVVVIPFALMAYIFSTIRMMYTVCCCTPMFCFVTSWPQQYFNDNNCKARSESCWSGYWRLLFHYWGTFMMVLTLIMVTTSQVYRYASMNKRRLEYDQYCQHNPVINDMPAALQVALMQPQMPVDP